MLLREAVDSSASPPSLAHLLPVGTLLTARSIRDLVDRALLLYSHEARVPPLPDSVLADIARQDCIALGLDPRTPERAAAFSRLESGVAKLVVSHQPTFLAYTGVVGQFELAKRLSETIGDSGPVILYVVLDADDAADSRIHSSHFPSAFCRNGSLALTAAYERARFKDVPHFLTPPVRPGDVAHWRQSILGVISQERARTGMPMRVARQRLEVAMHDMLGLAAGTGSYAAFNAGMIILAAQRRAGVTALPIRLTSLLKHAQDHLRALIDNWADIGRSARRHHEDLQSGGLETSVSSASFEWPLWALCPGCRRRFRVLSLNDAPPTGHDCGQRGIRGAASISAAVHLPRVLVEDLLVEAVLRPLMVLTYSGSVNHVVLSQWISHELHGRPMSSYTSRPVQAMYGSVAGVTDDPSEPSMTTRLKAAERVTSGRESMLYSNVFPQSLSTLTWPRLASTD